MLARLSEAPLSPFYVFFGKERFFVERCIDVVKRRIITSPDQAEILYYPLYGSEMNVAELLAIAQTPPFFDQTQLVLVREAEKLKEPCREALEQYAESPSPFTCMVLVAGEKPPKNRLFKKIQELWPQACLEFPELKGSKLRKWVERIAEEKGLGEKISAGALSGLIGEDPITLAALEGQMEMLSLFLEGEDLEGPDAGLPAAWHALPENQGWLLTDPLLKGNEQKTLAMLHRFLDQGTAPLLILGRIVWEVRRIQRVQEGMELGEPVEEACKAINILPFKRNLYISAARRIPASTLRRIFSSLREKDRSLKSSRMPPQWHLEDLCRQILEAVNAR